MPSLKEVRSRIATVKSTQQITSAMKMVAASKLRKTQNAILQMRPFANKLQELLQNLSASLEGSDFGSLSEQRAPHKILVIPVSSNRGLCGQFNYNVIRAVGNLLNNDYREQHAKGNVHLMTYGRKVSDFYRKRKYNVIEIMDHVFDDLTYENTVTHAQSLMKAFEERKYDRIVVVYNQFVNAATQRIRIEQFLPILPIKAGEKAGISRDYIFEPQKEQIVKELIPKSLKIQFYKMLLDSFAAEHGARMTAMHIATDNAKELIRELQLTYNKARQAAITKEILEIVSGAEALKSD